MVEVVRGGLRYLVPVSIGLLVALADLGNVNLLFAGTLLLLMSFVVAEAVVVERLVDGRGFAAGAALGALDALSYALRARSPSSGAVLIRASAANGRFWGYCAAEDPYTPAALRPCLRRARQADYHDYEEP